jgi:hypothetical protein
MVILLFYVVSEHVLQGELKDSWALRCPDDPKQLAVLGRIRIIRSEAVRHVIGLDAKIQTLRFFELKCP